MKKMFAAALAVFLVGMSLPAMAWAGDVQGKVRSLDAAGRILKLEDGTRLVIPPEMQIERDALQPGADVKASFDAMDGENFITDIEVQPADSNK
jgi:hypothetical protein